jgi:hypothetical protein
MNQPTDADTRSPWYETFTPQAAAAWVMAQPEAAPEAEQQPEAEWATEAMFDYYNE